MATVESVTTTKMNCSPSPCEDVSVPIDANEDIASILINWPRDGISSSLLTAMLSVEVSPAPNSKILLRTKDTGETLLHIACLRYSLSQIREKDVLNRTKLCAFVISRSSKEMLNHIVDLYQCPAFHTTARLGDISLMRLLTYHGADTHVRNSFGNNGVVIFFDGVRNRCHGYLSTEDELYMSDQILLTCCDPCHVFSGGRTILHVLAGTSCFYADLVEVALNDGAVDPSVRDDHGCTVLHYLCRQNGWTNKQLVKAVHSDNRCAGIINLRDKKGNTALHECVARQKRQSALIIILLENGATFNVANRKGQTPFDFCTEDAAFWAPLMAKHLDLRFAVTRETPGTTPLMHALRNRNNLNTAFVRLLLANGCRFVAGNRLYVVSIEESRVPSVMGLRLHPITNSMTMVKKFRRSLSAKLPWRPRKNTTFPQRWRLVSRTLYMLARAQWEPDRTKPEWTHRYRYEKSELHCLPEELLQYIVCFAMEAPYFVNVSALTLENGDAFEDAFR